MSSYVVMNDLELLFFLIPLSKCWDYRRALPPLVYMVLVTKHRWQALYQSNSRPGFRYSYLYYVDVIIGGAPSIEHSPELGPKGLNPRLTIHYPLGAFVCIHTRSNDNNDTRGHRRVTGTTQSSRLSITLLMAIRGTASLCLCRVWVVHMSPGR